MVIKCEIKFDNNPNAVYFSGQVISGTIELTSDKAKKIKNLCLKIEGFAFCSWTERQKYKSAGKSYSRNIILTGREDYLSTVTYLIGTVHGSPIPLAAGFQTYKFSCVLPPNLPTSFEAPLGHVRYTVTALLGRPSKQDLTYKVGFTVLKQQDLNNESPTLRLPVKKEITKSFFMGLLKNNDLTMNAIIPISGYVAGQTLSVAVEIDNPSNVAVEEIKVSLRKKIRYNSQVPTIGTKEEEETVRSDRYPGVPKKDKKNLILNFQIPAVPPCTMHDCRIIEVFYEIKVKAEMSGVHRSADIIFPITIGTVPLTTAYGNQIYPVRTMMAENATPSAPNMQDIGHFDDQLTAPSNAPSPYSAAQRGLDDLRDLPPPTYAEIYRNEGGVQVDQGDEYTMGHAAMFNPRYPLYDFGTSNNLPEKPKY